MMLLLLLAGCLEHAKGQVTLQVYNHRVELTFNVILMLLLL